MHIRRTTGILLVAAALLTTPAFAQADKVVRVGLASMVASMDPNARTSGPPSTIVFYPIFDTLTSINADGELAPALAESWRNVDPTTWEFELRPGVEFSNGEPLDAETVKWTLDRVLDPANQQVVRARIPTISKVEVVDPTTVRITTAEPDPILPKRLNSVFILPREHFETVGAEGFSEKPIGSGPFALESFDPSNSVSFRAVEGSWRGEPKIDGIQIRSIPDASTRVSALKAGEIHLAESIPPDLAEDVDSTEGLEVVSKALGQTNLIILNTSQIQDPRVRRALNYAVDKQAITEELMGGFAQPTGQLVAENGAGHDPSIEPYPYDPAKAQALLDEAGASGLNLTLHTTNGLQLNDKEVTEAVAGYLAAIGVQADVQVLETAAFVDGYHKGGMDPAFFIGWWYFPAMDGDFVLVWNESSRPQSRFKNAEFDELYKRSQTELDPQRREELLREMSRLFHEEAGGIFLYHPEQTYGISENLNGFEPRPDRVIGFDRMELE